MSAKAASLTAENIPRNRDSLISFPAGNTPVGMIREFVRMVNSGELDISRTRYVSLDEWVSLGVEDEGSCAYFNRHELLDKLRKPFLDVHIINGKAGDLAGECRSLDEYIDRHGPLDLSVLGIGLNGHLGFNEDGVDFNLNAHVIPLSATTRSVMHKYFPRELPLEYGITQGLKQIMAAKCVILIAGGAEKAEILGRAFHGPEDNSVPASILRGHPNCFVVADRAAAAKL